MNNNIRNGCSQFWIFDSAICRWFCIWNHITNFVQFFTRPIHFNLCSGCNLVRVYIWSTTTSTTTNMNIKESWNKRRSIQLDIQYRWIIIVRCRFQCPSVRDLFVCQCKQIRSVPIIWPDTSIWPSFLCQIFLFLST